MARTLLIVERNKAGLGYRFANYCIDFIFSIFLIWVFIAIVILFLYIVYGIDSDESFDYLANLNPLVDRIMTLLLYAFIMFLTEKFSY